MFELLWNNVVLETPSVWRTNTEVILSILPGVCWSVSSSQWQNLCVVKIKLNTEFEVGCGLTLLNTQSTFALLYLFIEDWVITNKLEPNYFTVTFLGWFVALLSRSCYCTVGHFPGIVAFTWCRTRERERKRSRRRMRWGWGKISYVWKASLCVSTRELEITPFSCTPLSRSLWYIM